MTKDSREEHPLGKMETAWTNDWSAPWDYPPITPDLVADSLLFKSLVRWFSKPIGKFKCLDCKEEYAMHFPEDELHSCYDCGSKNIESILFEEVE